MDDELIGKLHEAQMRIISALTEAVSARFSDLCEATGLSSDHANFHIKQLVGRGLVEHVPRTYGEYRLTRSGKGYATRMNTSSHTMEQTPRISVVLWVTNEEGCVLRQQRRKQPYYGYWTRPTGKVRRGETIIDAAARKLLEETKLTADWSIKGVEHRIDRDASGRLYDDKYLFTVVGRHPRGELSPQKAGMKNYWMSEEEYAKKTKRFGKPLSTDMLHTNEELLFNEGIFSFDEQDY
jgi:ADP-ribose pyrophosphatase YjhB (NUDIX family)/predicted transcriptional regulator